MRRSGMNIMLRLIVLVGPLLPVMFCAIVAGVLGFLAAIGITVFGGYALLNGVGFKTTYGVATIFSAIITCAVMRGVLRYAEQISGHYIAFKLLAVLRDKVFQALRRLAPAKLDDKEKGNLISIITSDIELLEVFYAHTIAPIAIGIITSIVMTAFIGSYNILLAGVAVAGYLTIGLIIPLAASRLGSRQGMEYRDSFGALGSYFLDSLRGMKESIQYDIGEQRMEVIDRKTADLDDKQKSLRRHEGIIKALTDTSVLAFSCLMLIASLYLMAEGQINLEGAVISTIAMFSSFGPVVALSSLSNNLLQTFASGERVLNILDEPSEVEEITDGIDVAFSGASCVDVSFAYDRYRILDHINIDLQKAKIIGVTGKSGSGKSTLLKLLMRYRDVQQGAVQVSGSNIKDVNTTCLRRLQSYVEQETYLFNDSIEENIKIGKRDANHQQVVDAARKASIHSFIMSLPQGYETNVGELGDRLSGGERQRIGLARAFLHDAPLMLLDEPTSNLDALNEAIILKSLSEERGNKTVVLVSHRSSTVDIADHVYHLAKGRIS